MSIGVILVSYNTGDVVLDCLESLLAAAGHPDAPDMKILLVDNASPDPVLPMLQAWADGTAPWSGDGKPFAPRTPRAAVHLDVKTYQTDGHHTALGSARDLTVGFLQSGANDGFAAGVNHGLRTFMAMEDVEYYWILNSDAMTEPQTPRLLQQRAAQIEDSGGTFGILGGRTYFTNPPLMIQTDGGRVDLKTGRLLPATLGKTGRDVPGPEDEALEYIPGCHMFVSPAFIETAGLMPEEYFLFYEEIDWCLRRGDLSFIWVPGADIHHESGASIGSQSLTSAPSKTAAYWMFRNRLRLIRRWNPKALPVCALYSVFKILQFVKGGHFAAATSAVRGLLQLPRPR